MISAALRGGKLWTCGARSAPSGSDPSAGLSKSLARAADAHMAKSTASKGKRTVKADPLPLPSPSPSSSSASPSGSDAGSDSDSSDSGSDRGSSASPEPLAAAQPRRDLDPEALSVSLVFLLSQNPAHAGLGPDARPVAFLCSKYSPPEGFKPVKASAVASGIDWDHIKEDGDLELWTVRVPAGVSSSHSRSQRGTPCPGY